MSETVITEASPPPEPAKDQMSFAEFRKQRDALNKQTGDTSAADSQKSASVKKDTPITPADAVKSSDNTPSDAVKSGKSPKVETKQTSDGKTDAGNQSDEAQNESAGKGELTPWMKERLKREKDLRVKTQKENSALEKRLAELEALVKNPSNTTEAKPKTEVTPPSDMETPLSDEKYVELYDMPEIEDYKTEEEFLVDWDRYEKNLPLKGGNYSQGGEKQDASSDKKQSAGDPLSLANDPKQLTLLMFDDLEDILDDSETADPNLSADFRDLFNANRLALSYEMVDWLLSNEEDAPVVMEKMVKRPGTANSIARKAPRNHGKLLSDLAKKLKSSTSESGSEKEQESVPTPKKLTGSSKNFSDPKPEDLATNYQLFKQVRSQM